MEKDRCSSTAPVPSAAPSVATAEDAAFRAGAKWGSNFARPQWFPIESAPKGEVLLYYPEVHKGDRNPLHPMYRVDYAGSTPFRRPTHWMPLPAPPTEPAQLSSRSNTDPSPNNNVSATPAGKGEPG